MNKALYTLMPEERQDNNCTYLKSIPGFEVGDIIRIKTVITCKDHRRIGYTAVYLSETLYKPFAIKEIYHENNTLNFYVKLQYFGGFDGQHIKSGDEIMLALYPSHRERLYNNKRLYPANIDSKYYKMDRKHLFLKELLPYLICCLLDNFTIIDTDKQKQAFIEHHTLGYYKSSLVIPKYGYCVDTQNIRATTIWYILS